MEKLVVVSVDSHAQPPPEMWPEYLERRFHEYLPELHEEHEQFREIFGGLIVDQIYSDPAGLRSRRAVPGERDGRSLRLRRAPGAHGPRRHRRRARVLRRSAHREHVLLELQPSLPDRGARRRRARVAPLAARHLRGRRRPHLPRWHRGLRAVPRHGRDLAGARLDRRTRLRRHVRAGHHRASRPPATVRRGVGPVLGADGRPRGHARRPRGIRARTGALRRRGLDAARRGRGGGRLQPRPARRAAHRRSSPTSSSRPCTHAGRWRS